MLSREWQYQLGHVHLGEGVPWEEGEEEEADG